jgi:hypothetical protein
MNFQRINYLTITQGYGSQTIVIDDPRFNLTKTVGKGDPFDTVIVDEEEEEDSRDFLRKTQGRENPASVVIVDLEKSS